MTDSIKPTGIKLDPAAKSRLRKLSELKCRTMHWLMKEAVLRYIAQEEQAEKLKQETLTRWHQEAEQNRVVNNRSVMAWLDTWGTDHETERPPCEK